MKVIPESGIALLFYCGKMRHMKANRPRILNYLEQRRAGWAILSVGAVPILKDIYVEECNRNSTPNRSGLG
jgi:hypothetical protein